MENKEVAYKAETGYTALIKRRNKQAVNTGASINSQLVTSFIKFSVPFAS